MENDVLHLLLSKFDVMETKFDKIESKIDAMETRFHKIESKMDEMESRFDKIESKIDIMQQDIKEIKYCVKSIEMTIENELQPNIMRVAEGHIDLNRKFNISQASVEKVSGEMKVVNNVCLNKPICHFPLLYI